MSQRDLNTGLNPTFLVDATAGNETVYLPSNFSVSRKFTVRRADNSVNTVTVALANGADTLDGTVGGSATVVGNGEKSFIPTNPGVWESFGPLSPAALAADPALTGTFARKIGQTIIHTGDSWTAFEGGRSVATPVQSLPAFTDSKGVLNIANVILRHALVVVGNAGIGGQTSANIAARFATDVVSYSPAFVKIQAGTNDVDATYNTTTNLAAMYDLAAAAGIIVVAATIPPNTGAPLAQRQYYLTVNRWIRDQARIRRNFILVDYAAAIADPATTWQALSGTLLVDNVHPNSNGAALMGLLLANALRPWLPMTNDYLACGTGEPDNLLTNPMLTGSGSTAPTGWSVTGSPTISYVARTDGVAGKWCQLVYGAGGAGNITPTNVSIGASLAIGDTIIAGIEFECDSLETPPPTDQSMSLTLQFYNGSTFFLKHFDLYWDTSYADFKYPYTSGVFQTTPVVVPATTTIVQMFPTCYGGGNYRFGRAFLRKVPTGTKYI